MTDVTDINNFSRLTRCYLLTRNIASHVFHKMNRHSNREKSYSYFYIVRSLINRKAEIDVKAKFYLIKEKKNQLTLIREIQEISASE